VKNAPSFEQPLGLHHIEDAFLREEEAGSRLATRLRDSALEDLVAVTPQLLRGREGQLALFALRHRQTG
jgi:hypothetical protein